MIIQTCIYHQHSGLIILFMHDSNVRQDKIYSKQLILWWTKETELPTLPSKAQCLHHYGNIPPHMKCQQNMDPKTGKKNTHKSELSPLLVVSRPPLFGLLRHPRIGGCQSTGIDPEYPQHSHSFYRPGTVLS